MRESVFLLILFMVVLKTYLRKFNISFGLIVISNLIGKPTIKELEVVVWSKYFAFGYLYTEV